MNSAIRQFRQFGNSAMWQLDKWATQQSNRNIGNLIIR
jgi:hypothetical protein